MDLFTHPFAECICEFFHEDMGQRSLPAIHSFLSKILIFRLRLNILILLPILGRKYCCE